MLEKGDVIRISARVHDLNTGTGIAVLRVIPFDAGRNETMEPVQSMTFALPLKVAQIYKGMAERSEKILPGDPLWIHVEFVDFHADDENKILIQIPGQKVIAVDMREVGVDRCTLHEPMFSIGSEVFCQETMEIVEVLDYERPEAYRVRAIDKTEAVEFIAQEEDLISRADFEDGVRAMFSKGR
jgi:hypothetical protein